MRAQRLVLLVLLCFASCVYVHDAARQSAAENAKSGFAAVAADSPNGDPIKQFTEHRDAVEALTREFHATREHVALDALLELPWSDLKKQEDDATKETDAQILTEATARDEVQKDLTARLDALSDITTKTSSLTEAMNKASRTASQHAATQELLRSALVAVAANDRGSFNSLRDVLQKKETVTEFKLENGVVTSSTKDETVGDLVGLSAGKLPVDLPKSVDDLGAWGEAIREIAKVGKKNGLTIRDPGIATTVIGLGLDLALAEETRARTEIAAAKSALKARKKLIDDLKSRSQALAANQRIVDRLISEHGVRADEKVRDSFERLSAIYINAHAALLKSGGETTKTDANAQTRGTLALAYATVAADYRARILTERGIELQRDRIVADDAQRALSIAATNLAEREAVIGRGMDGLVAFNQGGVNDTDVKNLIGVAQAAGLFAIGGL